MKNLLVASVQPNEGNKGKRVRLVLRKDADRYVWYEENGLVDTQVSGGTIAEAKRAAIASWDSHWWNFRLGR